ncbi:hypothetical protein CVIRNUC_002362 [Coccomyxa viridis]|uniref:26S proteasome non-ATPase regulatory subunit 4 homolog n=1 Tax=Coccomyxa viridis TaxID=1274662 RepID=A0AAV1HYK9_9CHLO|nr:hypothetical protein CVIRNUC_002362 [Coccomyxa viridis]
MEATVVCFDNSEYTRNGDYSPTRAQAQADAINLLAGAKTQDNPENTVGVLTMAGKSPRVLVTPTPDLGKILSSMQSLEIEGQANLASSVQIAQLALKHRQNKNQRQRIVIFIGSPLSEDKDKLVKVGKKLKKNNVAVDIVSFGSEESNAEKLEAFVQAVNSGENSHLVTVPAGTILADMLFGSPIFQTGGGAGYGAAAAGAGGEGTVPDGYEFGVDPNLDPELAMALRVSMQEERSRQEAAAASSDAAQPAAAEDGAAGGATAEGEKAADGAMPMDEDTLLQQALAMSMQVDGGAAEPETPAPAQRKSAPAAATAPNTAMLETDDEDLRLALQMSMGDTEEKGATSSSTGGGVADMLQDSEYMKSLLGSLPGVDPSDEALQGALASLSKKEDSKHTENNEKEKDKDMQ